MEPQGRLTLTSGTPVTTSDVIGAGTIYYTYYRGGNISLWNGSAWQQISPYTNNKSVALSTASVTTGTLYYVYGKIASSDLSLAISTTSWSYQNGAPCKSTDAQSLLLGMFYGTGTNTTEDSGGGVNTSGNRYLVNFWNRVNKAVQYMDTGGRSTSSATLAQVGAIQINYLSWGDTLIEVTGSSAVGASGVTPPFFGYITIGQSTSAIATGAIPGSFLGVGFSTSDVRVCTFLSEIPAAGQVVRYMLFASGAGTFATNEIYGSATDPTWLKASVPC